MVLEPSPPRPRAAPVQEGLPIRGSQLRIRRRPLPLGVGLLGTVLVSSVWALGLPVGAVGLPPWLSETATLRGVGGPAPACGDQSAVPSGALLVANTGPSGSFPAGSQLTVSLELEAVPFPGSVDSASVELPTVTAVFPTSGPAPESVVLSPRTVNVSNGGWSDPAQGTEGRVLGESVVFLTGANATLSTSLLALMTGAPVGALVVEARWSWSITYPGTAAVQGPWSLPGAAGSGASIVTPHPYVQLVGSSSPAATIGENFTVTLAGVPVAQLFPLKLENSSTGATLNLGGVEAPGNSDAPFSGTIPILASTGFLAPGSYLVHVHDRCGGILFNLPVAASYAASSTVRFAVSPTLCGPVSFDQTAYPSGRSWTGAPGPEVHALAVPSCPGHSFAEWQTSGGVSVTSGPGRAVSARVSADGTVAAVFR